MFTSNLLKAISYKYDVCDSWRPPIALGIAHATTEDDVYEGMFIPAGSTVIGNI